MNIIYMILVAVMIMSFLTIIFLFFQQHKLKKGKKALEKNAFMDKEIL